MSAWARRARTCGTRSPGTGHVGPRPGRTDVRGKVGASRAIQAALRDAVDRSPTGLALVLAGVIADGDPMRDMLPLFDAPDRATRPAPGAALPVGSMAGAVLLQARRPAPAPSLALFDT